MTRATKLLIKLKWAEAFRMNPLVYVVYPLMAIAIWQIFTDHRSRSNAELKMPRETNAD